MNSIVSVLLVVLFHGRAFGFAPFLEHHRAACRRHHDTTSLSLFMAKRKLSAKEKRKRRARQLTPRPVTGKPVNFNTKPAVVQELQETSPDDAAPPTQRAQQLLEAQRKSVEMLTLVREKVESLNYEDIQSSLSSSGYSVIDNFLDQGEIIDKLSQEGLDLFEHYDMETDLNNLGSGEYICSIQGGEKQYKISPRSVEFVVSLTKHMAPAFQGLNLDPSACMATMRIYDKETQQASLNLLPEELIPERPLSIVATDDNDARKISALYYPSDGGAGITLENGETISGKRDRLILFRSETCIHRKEPWNGSQVDYASSIELHLVQGG
jgi:hypothetical protein